MKKLGVNTQRAEYFAYDWITAHANGKTGLYDYYVDPSAAKVCAMEDLRVKFFDLWRDIGHDSHDLPFDYRPIVTSASCYQFTVMYIAPEPTTHEYCLYVETRCNTYYIPLEKTIPQQTQTALHRVRNEIGL